MGLVRPRDKKAPSDTASLNLSQLFFMGIPDKMVSEDNYYRYIDNLLFPLSLLFVEECYHTLSFLVILSSALDKTQGRRAESPFRKHLDFFPPAVPLRQKRVPNVALGETLRGEGTVSQTLFPLLVKYPTVKGSKGSDNMLFWCSVASHDSSLKGYQKCWFSEPLSSFTVGDASFFAKMMIHSEAKARAMTFDKVAWKCGRIILSLSRGVKNERLQQRGFLLAAVPPPSQPLQWSWAGLETSLQVAFFYLHQLNHITSTQKSTIDSGYYGQDFIWQFYDFWWSHSKIVPKFWFLFINCELYPKVWICITMD